MNYENKFSVLLLIQYDLLKINLLWLYTTKKKL